MSAAPGDRPRTGPRQGGTGRPLRSRVREYAQPLMITVLVAMLLRSYVVQAFVIPSGSMLPTLKVGDYLLANKVLYDFRPIRRGDIIVFKFPLDESRDFIKRVIGLPGETVEVRDGHVRIDGRELVEPYTIFRRPLGLRADDASQVIRTAVPPGYLFVMGDNRDNSLDSRSWGLLDARKVLGKAAVIYFSLRSNAIPDSTPLPHILYAFLHPSLLRWGRIGHSVE